MARFPKLSALLCVALLTSVSGVAAQAAPETPDGSTLAPDGSVQTPAAQPTEGGTVPVEEAPPAPSTQTSDESAPAADSAAPAAEAVAPAAAPAPASTEAQASTGLVLKTTTADRIDTDEQPAQPATCGSGTIALSSGGCGKSWRVIGYAEFSKLVVTRENPKNDQMALRFFAQGSYRVAKKYNVSVWGRIRYLQTFMADENESAARFQDPLVGIDYMHQLSAKEKGLDWLNLSFQHRITGSIPAQRESIQNDLYTRITGLERVRLNPIPSLYVGTDFVVGYNAFEYAEQEGPEGTSNPQADFSGTLVAEWYPWESEKYGSILLGVDGGFRYQVLYKGREGEVAQEENRLRPSYTWDLYAYYMPIPQIWIGAALSHGMATLRDGVSEVKILDRDSTAYSFNVTALY